MNNLLDEFRNLYEDRLSKVPSQPLEEALKSRIQIYRSYVNDLCEQNVVLVQTVQQLETEANEKIQNLEVKLQKAATFAKLSSKKSSDHESEMAKMQLDKRKTDNLVDELQARLQRMGTKHAEAHSKNARLSKDVDKLVEVITRARLQGEWDVTSVQFEELSNQAVFGLTNRGEPTREQELQAQLEERDRRVTELERELQRAKQEYTDFLQQMESHQMKPGDSKSVSNERIQIMKLTSEVRMQEESRDAFRQEVKEKHKKVDSLQRQITRLHEELALVTRDSSKHLASIEQWKGKYDQSSLQTEQIENSLRSMQEDYENQCLNLREETRRLETRIELLKSDVSQRSADVSKIEEEKVHLLESLQRVTKKLDEERKGSQKSFEKIGGLHKEISEKKSEVVCERDKVRALERERKDDFSRVSHLEVELETLQAAHHETLAQLDMMSSSLQQMELVGREREQSLSAEIAGTVSVASESKTRAEELDSRLRKSREVIQRLEEEGEQLRKEVREGNAQRDNLKDRLIESEKKCASALSDVSIFKSKMESLETRVGELRGGSERREGDLRAELTGGQNQISCLRSDLGLAQSKVQSAHAQILSMEEELESVQCAHAEKEALVNEQEGKLAGLKEEVSCLEEHNNKLQAKVASNQRTLSGLEDEVAHVKALHSQSLEENGRLHGRVQALQLQSQGEQETLNIEVKRYEDRLLKLKNDKKSLQETCLQLEEKIGNLTLDYRCLEESSLERTSEANACKERLDEALSTLKAKEEALVEKSSEITAMSTQIQKLTMQLDSLLEDKETLEETLVQKEQAGVQLDQQYGDVRRDNSELHFQLTQCEGAVSKMGCELEHAREHIESKQTENRAQSETIRKLEDALTRSEEKIGSAKKKFDTEAVDLEMKLSKAERHCEEATASVHKVVLERDYLKKELDVARVENGQLSASIKKYSSDVFAREQKTHQVEMDLAVYQEKYNTCREELTARERRLLEVQQTVNGHEQELSHATHEWRALQIEAEKLRSTVKSCQDELRHREKEHTQLMDTISELERRCASLHAAGEQAAETSCRLTSQVEGQREELVEKEQALVSQLGHQRDDLLAMERQLSQSNEAIARGQDHIRQLKEALDRKEEEFDRRAEEMVSISSQMAMREELIAELEKSLTETKQKEMIVGSQLKEAKKTVGHLEQQVSLTEQKADRAQEQADMTDKTVESLQQELAKYKHKASISEESLRQTEEELSTTKLLVEDKQRTISHREEVVEQLRKELEGVKEELRERQTQLEENGSKLGKAEEQLAAKLQELQAVSERLSAVENSFECYKENHLVENDEVGEKEELINELKEEIATVTAEFTAQSQKVASLNRKLSDLVSDKDHLSEVKHDYEKEISKLDSVVSALQSQLLESAQRHQERVGKHEADIQRLEHELIQDKEIITVLTQDGQKGGEQLRAWQAEGEMLQEALRGKNDQIEVMDEKMKDLTSEIRAMVKADKQAQETLCQLNVDVDRLKSDLMESRSMCKGIAKELARHEERELLQDQSLVTTQDQLRIKVMESVALEQRTGKLEAELEASREALVEGRRAGSEGRADTERLGRDLSQRVREAEEARGRELKAQQIVVRTEASLEEARDLGRRQAQKLEEQSRSVTDLQSDLSRVQNKSHEQERQLQQYKNLITDLQDDVDQQQRSQKEAHSKVRERDSAICEFRSELEGLARRLQAYKEEVAEKEGEIRVAQMNEAAARKQVEVYEQEARRFQEDSSKVKDELEESREKYRACHKQLLTQDQRVSELQVKVATLESTLDETTRQLADKSKAVSSMKAQMAQLDNQNRNLSEELQTTDRKWKHSQKEAKTLGEINGTTKEEIRKYDEQARLFSQEVKSSQGRTQQCLKELSSKEEELVMLRVDLASVQEKLNGKTGEAERQREECRKQQRCAMELQGEVDELKRTLAESRSSGDRLHQESELVVRNVNNWVDEQKRANEQLSAKIQEQNLSILTLQAHKQELEEDRQSCRTELMKLKVESNELRADHARFQALQEHSAQQKKLLRQLQNKLEEYELEQDGELRRKITMIEDLQQQLKDNLDHTRLLNKRVSELQQQNSQVMTQCEEECSRRKTLEMTLEQRNELIHTLRATQQARMAGLSASATATGYAHPTSTPQASRQHYGSQGVLHSSPGASGGAANLDKSYWIQRVGELSMQLQQSSSYWGDKVQHLQTQIDRPSTSTTKVSSA